MSSSSSRTYMASWVLPTQHAVTSALTPLTGHVAPVFAMVFASLRHSTLFFVVAALGVGFLCTPRFLARVGVWVLGVVVPAFLTIHVVEASTPSVQVYRMHLNV